MSINRQAGPEAQRDTLHSSIDREIDAYYDAYTRQLEDFRTERDALREHIVGLVVHNGSLRSRLASAQVQDVFSETDLATSIQPSNSATFNDLFVSKHDFVVLQQRHNDLRAEYQHTLAKYSAYKKTFHDMKQKVRDWQAYIQKKGEKDTDAVWSDVTFATRNHPQGNISENIRQQRPLLCVRPARIDGCPTPSFPSTDDVDVSKRSETPSLLGNAPGAARSVCSSPASDISDCAGLPPSTTGSTPVGSDVGHLVTNSRMRKPPMALTEIALEKLSSSQTTQDDNVRRVDVTAGNSVEQGSSKTTISSHEDADRPLVVSEKSLNRRKRSSGTSMYATATKRIKHELRSSPLMPSIAQRVLTRLDTLDLDNDVQMVNTPRKRPELEIMRQAKSFVHATAVDRLRNERTGSLPVDLGTQVMRPRLDQDVGHANDAVALTPDERHQSEPIYTVAESSGRRVEGRERDAHHNVGSSPRIRKPLSLSYSDLTYPKSHRRGASQIAVVTEDGEEPYRRRGFSPYINPKSSLAPGSEASRRLYSLLDAETPPKQALSFHRMPATSHALPQTTTSESLDELKHRPQFGLAKQDIMRGSNTSSMPTTQEKDLWTGTPPNSRALRHTALRHRPIQALKLSHFKINPAFNHDLSHAYTETVRGRHARHCLPGCAHRECCGDAFPALVTAGARPEVSRVLFGSSPPDQSEAAEEERLLRQFLGDAYRHDLTQNYRREMLVNARSRLLAKDRGWHKQTYERQRSPPGYWETGMPDTQTITKNRETAKDLEMAEVKERYEEATREGGRWLFRDE